MPGTSVFQKLKIITWKNYIIGKRHWISTICIIVLPVIMFGFLVHSYTDRSKVVPGDDKYTPDYNPQHSSEEFFKKINSGLKLYYTPQKKLTSSLIERVQSKLKLDSKSIKSFPTEDELLAYYEKNNGNVVNMSRIPIMGIVFNRIEGEEIPKHLDYSIRSYDWSILSWRTEHLYGGRGYIKGDGGAANKYVETDFIAIQLAVDISFIEMNVVRSDNRQNDFSLFLQVFPYPPYENRSLEILYVILIILSIVMCLLFSHSIVRRIVEEKFTGIRELMKMMGLKSWMLWLGWFLHQMILSIISISIIIYLLTTALGKLQFPVIAYCNRSLLASFLILYCAAAITFSFAISSLFNKPTIAVIVTFFVILLTKFVPDKILDQYPSMSGWWNKIWFALFPNMALTYGFQAILQYDSAETECNWINLFKSASGGKQDVTLGNVFVMFLIDMVVYMLIALYFENVKPGPYGLSKPFHFPVTYIFNRIKKKSNQIECCEYERSEDYCKIEAVTNLKAGIQIRNLYKNWGTYFAVNGLSIDIYEGQITALLGHNGAGKTTTMSIITGMIAASSGSVVVNGANIKYEMNKIHGIMGLCPQHNLQFTDLTVIEHLIFFGMLKGLTYGKARNESKILLQRLNLKSKQNSLASTLSGGMRRRLSLGIALIGNTKVLILDEPTSGLDPEARREIWDILLSFRGSRTIVLSTHFMEEADVLGDRIAIMDHGRLICYGTSMFLKKEYGAGYCLTIILNSSQQVNSNQGDNVTRIVKSIIDSAVSQSAIGNRFTYLLPFDEKPKFGALLIELEKQKKNLDIGNIALSITTLEEVFLKVGHLTSREDNSVIEIQPTISQVNPSKKLSGMTLYMEQINALFIKRFLTLKIKLWTFLFLVLLALLLTYLVLLGSDSTPPRNRKPEFKMDLSKYGETLVYYGPDSTNRDVNKVKKCYVEQVEAQGSRAISSESVSNAIIDKGIENFAYYKKHMVVAAEFNTSNKGASKINAMYSYTALHGAPISLNLITNAIVKALYGKTYGISISNNPLPRADLKAQTFSVDEIGIATVWFLLFPIGLLLCTASFVLYPQMEIANKAKQLQLMCGVRSYVYWLTFYIFDLVLYWMIVIAIIILILLFELWGSTPFSGKDEICALAAIMLVYGYCAIPYSYLFAYEISPSRAFTRCLNIGMYPSLILPMLIIWFELTNNILYNLIYLCLFLPQFGLSYTIVKFSYYACLNYNFLHLSDDARKQVCISNPHNPCCESLTSDACEEHLSYFEGDSRNISVYLDIMMASTILYFAILFLIESKLIFNVLECDCPKIGSDTGIVESRLEDNVLIVNNLTKVYKTPVVSDIGFVVKRGDCFGLLGVNGAGKTTTFRMLTGDEIPTEGDAEIKDFAGNSFKLSKNARKYLKNIGYCPQFDAIIEILTARQMLKLFAKLRGIPERRATKEVKEWISILGLQEYADKPCGKYSGGNKRKLSMAMAFIGNPPLVMLDEPTSGVDPVSRRKLWNVITLVQKQAVKTSIILCSHSMDECEALCDKLTIMKAGRLECSGTIPKIKQKYGRGFTVKIKLKDVVKRETVGKSESAGYETTSVATQQIELSDIAVTIDNVRQNSKSDEAKEVQQLMSDFEQKYFGTCELCDKHSGLLHYRITDHKIKLGQLFNEMEDLSRKHSIIEDFQISDTTLEEVFLSIARSKNETSLQL